ncbi:MAG TPA: hypothetical protein VGN07_17660 [Steroidobacteraceae bacterium]|jgi:hypothetical protein
MTEPKKHNVFWPSVSSLGDAKKAAGYGTGAAIVVAVITAAFATWTLVSKSTVIGYIDAWAYVDAILFSAVAFGVHKESRFSALAGLALFILEKTHQMYATGQFQFQGAVLAVFLTMMFVSSVRGTFALRHLRKQSDGQQGVPADQPRPAGSAGS